MFRYQILIEYVGTNFRGWQVQKKGKTIQGLIQEKISKLLKEKIILFGSGRTDSGVHAIEQSAHFNCKNKIIKFDRFLKSINHFLNKEGVAIIKVKKRLGANFDLFNSEGVFFDKQQVVIEKLLSIALGDRQETSIKINGNSISVNDSTIKIPSH